MSGPIRVAGPPPHPPQKPVRTGINVSLLESSAVLFCVSVVAFRSRAQELAAETGEMKVRERRACVLSCIINSVCWAEAYASEIFYRCAEMKKHGSLKDVPADRVAVAALLWTEGHSGRKTNAIDRWNLLLGALDKEQLKAAAGKPKPTEVQDMQLLIDFRNHCVHAEPTEWPAVHPSHIDLERALRAKGFALSQFKGQTTFFYQEVLSPECAFWAVDTAKAFVNHASDLLGAPHEFDSFV